MISSKTVEIGKRLVGSVEAPYIIAEIGSNHDQDVEVALDMIHQAADAGADAVKFQSIRFDKLYSLPLESESIRDFFRQIELSEDWYPRLAECAFAAGVDFLSAPTYVDAIDLLVEVGVPAIKIASPQVQGNLPLLRKAAETRLPLILSMGYATYGDVANAVRVCREVGNEQLIVLHCVSEYPTDPAHARLRFMETLSNMTGCLIGFSDHTLGTHLAVAAVALGACVIEKHVTIDRTRSGPDHHFALTFPEFRKLVSDIREIHTALGDGTRINLLAEEMRARNRVKLKAVSACPLSTGEGLTSSSVTYFRSELDGIAATELVDIERYVARHSISKGALLQWSDLQLR